MKRFAEKWWWRTCLFVALAGNGRASTSGELAQAWEPAVQQLAIDLDALAGWCHDERLFARRDFAYELLLTLDPEHREARRSLHYERQRDGSWKQSGRAHATKDYGTEHLAEYEQRRAAMIARFRDPLLALADRPLERLEAAELERLWSTLLLLDPEDARAHAAHGEVKDGAGGAWVLRETAAAAERGRELERALAAALASIGAPDESAPTPAEEAFGLRWTVRATEHVRVRGTCDERSIEECARGAELALAMFSAVCATDAAPPSDYAIDLLATEQDREQFLSRHPRIDGERAAEARRHSSYWIPGTTELAIFPASREVRLEHALRQSIALMIVRHCAIGPEAGWVYEGLGTYLTELVAGRSPSQSDGSDAAGGERAGASARLSAVDGGGRTAGGGAPTATGGELGLEQILRKSADALDGGERRTCTALFRYLVEGRPGDLDRVLMLTARDHRGAEVIERALGCSVPELEARLARFLREVAATDVAKEQALTDPGCARKTPGTPKGRDHR